MASFLTSKPDNIDPSDQAFSHDQFYYHRNVVGTQQGTTRNIISSEAPHDRLSDFIKGALTPVDDSLSSVDYVFANSSAFLTVLSALIILSYRIFLRILGPSWREDVLFATKISVGWVTSNLFCHYIRIPREYVTFFFSSFASLVTGGPDCLVISFSFLWLGWLLSAWGGAYLNLQKQWWAGAVEMLLGVVFAAGFMCFKPVFQNWELLILPALGTTALGAIVGLPIGVWTDSYPDSFPTVAFAKNILGDFDTPHDLLIGWAYVWAFAVLVQIISLYSPFGMDKHIPNNLAGGRGGPRSAVDVSNPDGGQNDVLRRMLLDENLTREDMFESRFPMLSTIANGASDETLSQGLRDVINSSVGESRSGGMEERARAMGIELTENQIKILEICAVDEEERNRILFGGGLW